MPVFVVMEIEDREVNTNCIPNTLIYLRLLNYYHDLELVLLHDMYSSINFLTIRYKMSFTSDGDLLYYKNSYSSLLPGKIQSISTSYSIY